MKVKGFIFIGVSLVLSLSIFAGSSMAVEISKDANTDQKAISFDAEKAKKDLAEKYSANYTPMSEVQEKARSKSIDEKLCKLIAEGARQSDIDKEMSKSKVYRLDVPVTNNFVAMSQPASAICNDVSIFYDSEAKQWVVSGGGNWQDTTWFSDRYSYWAGIAGEVHDCGGLDSVGIVYNNTTGTYNASVISSMGYMTDQNDWGDYSYSPSYGDGKLGVAFDYQDKHRLNNTKLVFSASDMSFYGKGYSALIRYNSNFQTYHGNARIFYAHTWSSATINSISFGGSGASYGLTVNFTPNNSNCWRIVTNSDTQF